MNIISELKKTYQPNAPIFLKDIEINGVSNEKVRQALSRSKEIKRYDQGIYYFPKKTIIGDSILSFNDVINAKYITNKKEIIGYYTGLSFLNYLGITTQVPNVLEIVTNNETANKRIVKVGGRTVILRRGKIAINNDNYRILQLLDSFNYLETYQVKDNYLIFEKYIKDKKFNKKDIISLLPKYSRKVLNIFIESGLIYEITS